MLADHKGEIPFVVYLLPFISGIGIALSLHLAGYQQFFASLLITFCLCFVVLNLSYLRLKLYRNRWIGGGLIHLILITAGLLFTIRYDDRIDSRYFEKSKADYLVVKINSEPQYKNNLVRFTASVDWNVCRGQQKKSAGNILVAIRADSMKAKQFQYGDELLIPATFHPVDPPFNPSEFNYKQYLARQNIYTQAFLNPGQFVLLQKNSGNPVIAYAIALRQRMIEKLKIHLHSQEAIAVASTLILGYKADLSDDVLQAYSKTGTIHVLSVSGSHVAIIFALLSWMFGFFDRYQHGKLAKGVISVLLIWFYSMLTGFSPAVCRAAVMISLIIIGKVYFRQINTLNILAFSAFLLLIYNPFLLADVGFQLSYLSVAGLIVFQPIVYRQLDISNKYLDWLWAFFSASIAAQLITFPLSAFYFHQFPVYFLLSNLFILPLSAVIMYAGIAYFVVWWIPVLGVVMGWILEKSILLMDDGLAMIEHSPYASISRIWFNHLENLLLYGLIVLLFYWLHNKKAWKLQAGLASLLILAVSMSFRSIRSDNDNRIIFLNLKKHQGVLFKSGSKAVILTDLSDTDKNYRYSLQPVMDSLLINTMQTCKPDSSIKTSFLLKKGNLVQFYDLRLLIFDKKLEDLILPVKLSVDYLFVTGSPHNNIDLINRNYSYKLLIIDAGNSDQSVKKLEASAIAANKKFISLKRNFSFTLESK